MQNQTAKIKKARTGMLKCIDSSKNGQIGATLTWIVATIIIIFILSIAISIASSYLGKNKNVNSNKNLDTIASKSFFSYLLTQENGGKNVYKQLQTEEKLNDFNGNLAKDIFKEYYKEEYKNIWVGLELDLETERYAQNTYFGKRPLTVSGGMAADVPIDIAYPGTERIKLNDGKYAELVLNNA